MENHELDSLNLKKSEEQSSVEKNDLSVLNLKKQKEEPKIYNNLDGTGVTSLRFISSIMIVTGVILCFVGIILIADAKSYEPEKRYMGFACIYIAISCFVVSPIYKVLAIIGEAAKIFKDKNTPANTQNNIQSTEENVSPKKEQNSFGLKVGDKVQHKTRYTDKIMIVGFVNTDGSCFCTNENGKTYGTFNADELMKV